jgi:hypothetical protein
VSYFRVLVPVFVEVVVEIDDEEKEPYISAQRQGIDEVDDKIKWGRELTVRSRIPSIGVSPRVSRIVEGR